MAHIPMDVEEIHTILKGATRVENHKKHGKIIENDGSNFDLTLKFFKECGIIDGKHITEWTFIRSYERLAPNREDLTLTQMVTLFGIFHRETRVPVEDFALRFEQIKDDIVEEITNYWQERPEEKPYKM